MTRREVRDCAFKILFEILLRNDPLEELYAIADEVDEITLTDDVKKLIEGTIAHSAEIDELISKYSVKRSINRIAKINLAVLRLAFFEIMYDDGTPENAAIKEAVLLSQTYAQEEDVSFVNGVLGAYSRSRAQAGECLENA